MLADVEGDAWFDDIAVWQLPHVEIGTASPSNITREPFGPTWNVSVRDLVGGRLTARLRIYDHDLNLIATDERPMGWGAPSDWNWTPRLDRFGWYLAELAVLEADQASRRRPSRNRSLTFGGPPPSLSLGDPVAPDPAPATSAGQANQQLRLPEEDQADAASLAQPTSHIIARTYNAVLWLPPGTGPVGPDAERFALVATGLDQQQLELLPELTQKVGLGSVVISAWDRATTLGGLDLRLEALRQVLNPLKAAGRNVEMSFEPVPELLQHTRGINTQSPEGVLAADPSIWMPYVQPILNRHGQSVKDWHLGSARDPEAAYMPRLPQMVDQVYQNFRHWTPAPRLILPWRLDQPFRDDLKKKTVAYDVGWPAGVLPQRLIDHMEQPSAWAAPDARRRLFIEPAPADQVPHAARVADLALRMVHAWEQNATGVALPHLWTPGLERRPSLLPDPLLGVASNIATRLAGYRAIGRLKLGEDRQAIVFHRNLTPAEEIQQSADAATDGLLVTWNLKAPSDHSTLDMYLGDAPVSYDVWGNPTPLPLGPEGKHLIQLTDTPQFITGINPELAMMRSSFDIDQPFIASTQTPHVRTLSLSNPWPVTISGKFTINGPRGWAFKPAQHSFSIGPGQTINLPIALQFPVHEVAGDKELTADFDFTADRRYQVTFSTPIRIGLEGVRFESSLSLKNGSEPGKIDAAVTCIITNTGNEELSLNVFASLFGRSRKERLIPRLEPGQAVIRQFNFPDAGASLAEQDIRIGVRETNGPAVLNQTVGLSNLE